MTISYDTVKGTAKKTFNISISEKYRSFYFEASSCNHAIKTVTQEIPELRNYSFIMEPYKHNDSIKLIVICKGSQTLEKLQAKYTEEYFQVIGDKILPFFTKEIYKSLSYQLIHSVSKHYSQNSIYYPSALKVKTKTQEIIAKEYALTKLKEAMSQIELDIKKTNLELLELTKPIAVNEILTSDFLTPVEKEEVLKTARLK